MDEVPRVFFDTSVIVPGLIDGHQFHGAVTPYFQQVAQREIERVISARGLAETFRWLSALQITGAPPLSPPQAAQMTGRLAEQSSVVELGRDDYRETLGRMADLDRGGPAIYDVLHGLAALKAECETLLTLDRDFYRLGPEIAGLVEIPSDGS